MNAPARTPEDRITALARQLGRAVQRGFIADDFAAWSVENAAFTAPWAPAEPDRCHEIAALGWRVLDDILTRPGIAAEDAIRREIQPLMAARQPRAAVLIAAYRAADGRLSAADVETVVAREIEAFMARLRPAAVAPAHRERRHA